MSLTYRPEIDGLRAIAVTSVILFHSGLVPLSGGFAGVDVFFVISGFLVTSILLKDLGAGRHTVWRFYERRVRRILPALLVMLTVTSLAAAVLMIPPQLQAYSKSLVAVLLFLSNFLFGANSGYFSPALEEAPLLHTWSLSIEEQYYLLFPVILSGLLRRGPRAVTLGLWAMAGASLALAQWGALVKPEMNFFFSLSRFWELLAGSLAAWAVHRRPLGAHGPVALLGLGLILASMVLHSERTAYPSVHTVIPVIGSVLVLLFAGQGTMVGRFLSLRPVVGVGLISYSAYLWHQPLFALLRVSAFEAPPDWAVWGMVGLSYLLGWLSWRWVEQPFRRPTGRWLPTPRALFSGAALACGAMLIVGAVELASKGNDRLWRLAHPDQATVLDLILTAQRDTALPASDGPCRFNLTRLTEPEKTRIRSCAAQHGPAAVVLGDSHGVDMFNAMKQAGHARFLLGVANGGCRPADDDAACPFADFLTLVQAEPQLFGQILFVQSGAYLLLGPDGREGSRQLFTRASLHKPMPAFGVNTKALGQIEAYLKALHSAGVPVLWVSPRIEPHIAASRVLRSGCATVPALRAGQVAAFDRLDLAVGDAAVRAGVAHLPMSAYGFDLAQDFMTCDALYWSDGDHWSSAGEARFGARLLPQLPGAFR